GAPAGQAILREEPTRRLNASQPNQRPKRCFLLPSSKQRVCALHEITRPDEMIPAEIIVTFDLAPRNGERCDDRALKNLVFMREQNATRQPIHTAAIAGLGGEIELISDVGAMPLAHESVALAFKPISQALQ